MTKLCAPEFIFDAMSQTRQGSEKCSYVIPVYVQLISRNSAQDFEQHFSKVYFLGFIYQAINTED
jgi:tryptophan synthase alpha subunit